MFVIRLFVPILSIALVGAFAFSHQAQASGSIILNELMWGGEEYIELFNTGSSNSLEGWKITRQKAGGEEETIINLSGSISNGAYFLIERTEETSSSPADLVASFRLVNEGELVRLYDSGGALIDAVNRQGAWYAGSSANGGASMERASSGSDGTVKESWKTSSGSAGGRTGTPGQSNSSNGENSTPIPSPELEEDTPVYSTAIIINEVMPNPEGSDTAGEFIELHNTGPSTVDLSSWQLDDGEGGSKPYTIPSGTNIGAGTYLVFKYEHTKLTLNNDSDAVRLMHPSGAITSSMSYGDSPAEGISVSRASDGSFQQSTSPTPGAKNVITAPIEPTSTPSASPVPSPSASASPKVAGASSSSVVINEFLANPTGPDTEEEFIEIKNVGTTSVNLSGWQLDDAEGGSTPFSLPEGTTIGTGKILSFRRTITGIALNNTEDEVRLLTPSGSVASSYAYPTAPQGQSYARTAQGAYILTGAITEGTENTVSGGQSNGGDVGGNVAGATTRTIRTSTAEHEEAEEISPIPTDTPQDESSTISQDGTSPSRSYRPMAITLGSGVVVMLGVAAAARKENILAFIQKVRYKLFP